jgi:hypothetical protein
MGQHKLGTNPIGEKVLLVTVPEESKLELLLLKKRRVQLYF